MISQQEAAFFQKIGIDCTKRLHLEISSGCNLRCPMCTFHDEREKKSWTPLSQIKTLGKSVNNFHSVHIGDGSEPLINPEWDKIVSHLSNQGIKVSLQTNGSLIRSPRDAERLVNSGLQLLSISIDGITDSTVSRIRQGTNFTTIDKAISLINAAKQKLGKTTPHLMANCVAMASNLQELPKLAMYLAEKEFIRIRIGLLELRKPNPDLVSELLIYDQDTAFNMAREVHERMKEQWPSIYLDIDLFEKCTNTARRDKCTVYEDRIYARHDGNAYACYGKMHLGNIYEDGIESCLTSDNYKKFCKSITVPGNQTCQACTFCRVMAFDNIKDHFGAAAIDFYSLPKIKEALDWTKEGGDPAEFWDNFYRTL